jgi:hypothetical protein
LKRCKGELKDFNKKITEEDKKDIMNKTKVFKDQIDSLESMIQENINAEWTKTLKANLKIFEDNKMLEMCSKNVSVENEKTEEYLTVIRLKEAYNSLSIIYDSIKLANDIIIFLAKENYRLKYSNISNAEELKEMSANDSITKNGVKVMIREAEDSFEEEEKAFCRLKIQEEICRQKIEELNNEKAKLEKESKDIENKIKASQKEHRKLYAGYEAVCKIIDEVNVKGISIRDTLRDFKNCLIRFKNTISEEKKS